MDGHSELLDALAAAAAPLAGYGVCDAAPFAEARLGMEARISGGLEGRLGFTFTDPATATDIRASFPWAERLVVGAWAYLPAAGTPGRATPGTGRVARFATADHYRPLRSVLDRIAAVLGAAGHRTAVLADDSRLMDRAAAVRAGVGWWGKNTMVLAPASGPWLLLGSVVTDARLPVAIPPGRSCGTCTACIPACPTGALVAPGILDARRCLAALAQLPGVIPGPYREAMGDRIYGCDDCLEACPPGTRLMESATEIHGRIDLVELLAADDRSLVRRFAHFYLPRRDARYLRRNALVALGNSGDRAVVGVVAGYLGHPDWLLRLHAAWALGRLGGPGAAAAVSFRRSLEAHPEVSAELDAAAEALTGGW